MKSNYYEHLAWFELSVKPNVVTPSTSDTRCWHATKKKHIPPFNLTIPKPSPLNSNIDTHDGEITNKRKRRRMNSDEDDEEEEEEEEEDECITFSSVGVQTSPLLRGIERTESMETIYFDACNDLSLDRQETDKNTLLDKIIYEQLNTLFDINTFIPNQYEAIQSTLKDEHVLLVLPTGPCRELCYLLPSTMTAQHKKRNGKTFVLCPSRSHLPTKDLYAKIPKRIVTKDLNQGPWITIEQLYEELCQHDIKVVYITIKDFVKYKLIIQSLYNQNLISRLVIEESHCLSARSQGEFKVMYPRLISEIRSVYPDLPIMAVTSIPFDTTHGDIIDVLSIPNCKIYKKSLIF